MRIAIVAAFLVGLIAADTEAVTGIKRYVRQGVYLTAITAGAYIDEGDTERNEHMVMLPDADPKACAVTVATFEGANALQYSEHVRDILNQSLRMATFRPVKR